MLGTEENAVFIRNWHLGGGEYSPPAGWSYIDSGSYRAVYRGPDDYVYKVDHSYYYSSDSGNLSEYSSLKRLMFKKPPEGCRLPRYTYHPLDGRGVMVMEYFGKLVTHYSTSSEPGLTLYQAQDRLESFVAPLWDVYGCNVGVDIDTMQVVPLDLGC